MEVRGRRRIQRYLFINRRPFTKNDVAAQQTSKERVGAARLAPVCLLLDEHERLVQCHKLCEIERVLFRGAEDDARSGLQACLYKVMLRWD
jgi:hypothetical protein